MLLLLNPPSPPDAVANREGTASFGALSSGFAYPPHTLAVIVAVCRQQEIATSLIDAVADKLDLDACTARIQALRPSHLVIYTSWATLDADRAALSALRLAFPHLPRIAIGAGARYNADELLVSGATHVLLGDPELALPALAPRPLPPPGLVRTHDLLPDQHNHAGLLRDPSRLPRPAWDAVPWQPYGSLSVFGARGCDDHCKFCAYAAVQGHSYRPRPASEVADEMLWLQTTFRPRRILVRDLVFAADRARAITIARQLSATRRGAVPFRIPWECESRPEHFDATLLEQMAAAGCTVIKLGIETTAPDLLVQLGRIETPAEAAHYLAYTRRVVADARRFGIQTRVFVMAGLPGQSLEHARATAAFLREIEPTFVHPRPYTAFPRVPLDPAQPPAQMSALLEPLAAVAAEREAIYAIHTRRRPTWRQRVWHSLRQRY